MKLISFQVKVCDNGKSDCSDSTHNFTETCLSASESVKQNCCLEKLQTSETICKPSTPETSPTSEKSHRNHSHSTEMLLHPIAAKSNRAKSLNLPEIIGRREKLL